uniref:Endonuclease domain-containing 1 protein-like n=1 Tax=Varanus komodoensis TaxID=61221 RepID=A0A8D2Q662_VARKO
MGPLLLLGVSVLLAWPALAEVGTFNNCKRSFYKNTAPHWFAGNSMRNICQRYNNVYHYATLYDTGLRIAYWSAYTLFTGTCPSQPRRRNQWFIEPQLTVPTASPNMLTEAASNLSRDQLKQNQAISIDYESTTFDRGHLNPNLFQCDASRNATFTLTNAVPMDPCFNRVRWSRLEVALKDQLTISCPGTPYLVTGTVPDPAERIPDPRVSVPSHIWTAVCCDNANQNLKFSFAFLAENREESLMRILKVSELEGFLEGLYNKPVQIFADDCNADNQKGRDVLNVIYHALFKGFRDLIENNYLLMLSESQRNTLDQNTQVATTSMDVNQTSLRLTNVDFSFGFKNLHDWDLLRLHLPARFPSAPPGPLFCLQRSWRNGCAHRAWDCRSEAASFPLNTASTVCRGLCRGGCPGHRELAPFVKSSHGGPHRTKRRSVNGFEGLWPANREHWVASCM